MTQNNKPYEAGMNGTSNYDRDTLGIGGWCVRGPGWGCGYYSFGLSPDTQFETYEQAELVAKMMNIAFQQGIAEQKRRVKEVLM